MQSLPPNKGALHALIEETPTRASASSEAQDYVVYIYIEIFKEKY